MKSVKAMKTNTRSAPKFRPPPGLEGKVACVAIIGAYRSGKSFLLNQLMRLLLPADAPPIQPFVVGHTVHPETEEVLAYLLPACLNPLPNSPGTSLLLLDSPGLFAPNRPQLFDAQLLAVFNLLSSVVLYNTVHVVDRNAIEQLSIALDAASLLSYQAAPAGAATSGTNPYAAIGDKQGQSQGQGQGPGSSQMVVRSAEGGGGGGGGGGGSQPGEEHGVVALDYKSEEPALMSRPHLMWVLQVRKKHNLFDRRRYVDVSKICATCLFRDASRYAALVAPRHVLRRIQRRV